MHEWKPFTDKHIVTTEVNHSTHSIHLCQSTSWRPPPDTSVPAKLLEMVFVMLIQQTPKPFCVLEGGWFAVILKRLAAGERAFIQ